MTESNSSMQSPSLSSMQENESGDFQPGYFVGPKGKRGMNDEYFSSISSSKGSGAVNIKLPHKTV